MQTNADEVIQQHSRPGRLYTIVLGNDFYFFYDYYYDLSSMIIIFINFYHGQVSYL